MCSYRLYAINLVWLIPILNIKDVHVCVLPLSSTMQLSSQIHLGADFICFLPFPCKKLVALHVPLVLIDRGEER